MKGNKLWKGIWIIIILWLISIPIGALITPLAAEWGIYPDVNGFYNTNHSVDGICNFYVVSKMIIFLPGLFLGDKPITKIIAYIVYWPLIIIVASSVYEASRKK